jgi:TetR/AcrR family transcriptional regulator
VTAKSGSTAAGAGDGAAGAADEAAGTSDILPPARGARPRRAPAPEDRQRDAERSKRCLLAAALDEFAAKGFAGARVQDIAERAGVNKQLISYYFGGKEGLYRALQRSWQESEAGFGGPGRPIEELALRYLHEGLADPRPARLMLWRSLGPGPGQPPDDSPVFEDVASMRQRQASGELTADLDARFLRIALMAVVLAPMMMPHMAEKIFGVAPDSPEFEGLYGEQLRAMLRHLSGRSE